MHNSDHIAAVLAQVEKLWHRHPDWRLGQLVSNVAAWADPTRDLLWDLEDEVLVAEIERHLSQLSQGAHAR